MKRGSARPQVQISNRSDNARTNHPVLDSDVEENNEKRTHVLNMLSPALNTRSRNKCGFRQLDIAKPEITRSRSPVSKRRLNGSNNIRRSSGETNLSPVLISSPIRSNMYMPHSVLTPKQNQSFGNDSLANESFLCALDSVEQANLDDKNKYGAQGDICKTDVDVFDDSMNKLFEQSFDDLNKLYHSPDHSTPKSRPELNGTNLRSEGIEEKPSSALQSNGQEVITASEYVRALPAEQLPGKSKSAPLRGSKKKTVKKKGGKGNSGFKTAYTNRKEIQLLSESGGNELSREDLSALTEDEKLLLSSWSLPESVVSKYRSKGISSLFPWQLECLTNMKVFFEGKNLLYSAPTSAGKTLVAEILMLKRVVELGKKAIMILPFVSVAREKMYSLQELFVDAGVRVEGFMGSYNPPGGFKAVDIAICTIEKANSLINRLITEDSLSQLGTIVVDELHLVGDPHRGYLLELMLTKIKFMSSKQSPNIISESQNGSPKSTGLNIQIIGMSATLPNLPLLADWLHAELVTSDYRPVPLSEKIKITDKIYESSLALARPVHQESLPIKMQNDTDDVLYLSLETILEGHSVLIFCPTKAWCEKLAEQIAREFFNIGRPNSNRPPEIGQKLREQLNSVKIAELLEQLKQCVAGKDEMLAVTAAFGVGFHHAGLTFDERDILESAFKRGVLRVIVATSTLSAGVNLPARRVIIASPVFNGCPLDPLTYKQMSGRAGRKGVDTEGESILICQTGNHDAGIRLIKSALPSVKSALLGQTGSLTSSMKRALLEVIASGAARSALEVQNYSKATLLSAANDSEEDPPASQANANTTIDECLQFLEKNEFIKLVQYEDNDKSDEYIATQLGSACLASSLSPDEGIVVFKELLRARQCFVLSNELHVIYQVTPIYLSDQWRNLNWHHFLKIFESLSSDELRVCQQVGVEETFILNAMMSGVSWKNPAHRAKLSIHQRFYTALALNDLVNEMPITKVAAKYEVNKGVIQNLQQAASTFAGMVTAFCGRLGWGNLELLLSQFQDRLQFGVQRELCDLVKLSLVNGQRARILYNAGVETLADLAAADPAQIEQIYHKAGPFSSNVHGKQDEIRTVYIMGKLQALTEGELAQMVVKEARQFLQIELKLEAVQFAGCDKENVKVLMKSAAENRQHALPLTVTTAVVNIGEDSQKKVLNHSSNLCKVDILDPDGPNNDLIEDIMSELSYSLVQDLDDREKEETNRTGKLVVANGDRLDVPINGVGPDSDSDRTVSHIGSLSANSSTEMFEESGPLVDIDKSAAGEISSRVHPQVSGEIAQLKCQNINIPNPVITVDMLVDDDNDEIGPSEEVNLDNEISFMDMSLNSVHLSDDGIATEFFIGNKDRKEEGDSKESASLFGTSSSSSELFEQSNHSSSSIEIFSSASRETREIHLPPVANINMPSSSINHRKTKKPFSPEPHPHCSSFSDGADEEHGQVLKQSSFRSSSVAVEILLPDVTKYGILRSKDKIVKVQVIPDIINLPRELLSSGNPISLCLKIKEPKKVLSYTRCKIGAKIMRRSRSKACCKDAYGGQAKGETSYEYTVTLYAGGETVWIYSWKSSSTSRPLMSQVVTTDTRFSLHQHQGQAPQDPKSGKSCVVELILNQIVHAGCPIILLNAQTKIRNLIKHFGDHLLNHLLLCSEQLWDPKIAAWLCQETDDELDNNDNWLNTEKLMDLHLDGEDRMGLIESFWPNEAREPYLSWIFMSKLKVKLEDCLLWELFTTVEMPSVLPIVSMEINGFCFNAAEFERLQKVLKLKSALLELKAFKIVGRQFNISSTKDLQKVLFGELKLGRPPKTRGIGKDVLLKLDHIMASIIIEWRKVHHALQLIFPFSQAQNPKTGRIHGLYTHFSITGRVIMAEPSIQFIPRDFDLKITFTREEIESLRTDITIVGPKVSTLLSVIDEGLMMENERHQNPDFGSSSVCIKIENLDSISMRNAFCSPSEDYVLVAADYSQLELRILAILSEDLNLIKTLNSGKDVFKAIASGWKKIPLHQVNTELRQEAKSIVYAIIYGMGKNSLSEKMMVSVETAAAYIEQFMKSYPGVRSFITSTIKSCKQKGYVQTFLGRRRFLPHINSREQSLKSQAERQAVNSRVQGSASDVVKKSMARVQSMMSLLASEKSSNGNANLPSYVILNLHDELIFEVKKDCLVDFASRLRSAMENPLALPIHVALPVNIKTGNTWGSLVLYE